ncbi:uncharacterized protein LOC113870256 [Abrus precatorius]|uniref:RING-type E3 ubiquitin transferase n=1 Tax=Abrus precatorius TaxID=3816 RepID=A0A8B8M288_ABRPR|nr:uncharacterized protein LOC113870256 [Abrus precatorius]
MRFLSSPSSPNRSGDGRFPVRLAGTNLRPYGESSSVAPINNDQNNLGVFPRESFAIGPFGMNVSSSSSFPASFSGRHFGLNSNHFLHPRSGSSNITPSNGGSAVDMHLAAEHVGNNHYNNQNLPSYSVSLHPHGSNASSSAVNANNSAEYVVEERGGVDGNSPNMRHLPFKRRYDDEYALSEFAVGESSSMGAQDARNPRRRVDPFQVNAIGTCPFSGYGHSGNSTVEIGHSATCPVSNEIGQTQNLQSHNNLQVNMLSSRGHFQRDHPPFFDHEETSLGGFGLEHPMEYAPNVLETQQALWSNSIMRPRYARDASYSVMGRTSDEGMNMIPFDNNIPAAGNFMSPQIGTGSNWSSNGNANILGCFSPTSSNQLRSAHGNEPSNAGASIHRLEVYEQYIRLSPITASQLVASSIGSYQPRNPSLPLLPSEISQGSFNVGVVSENQQNSFARLENRAGASAVNLTAAEMLSTMWEEVRSVLEFLREDIPLQTEGLLILEDSIVINMAQPDSIPDWRYFPLSANFVPYEMIAALQRHLGHAEAGLREEYILSNIEREIFQSITEGSPQNETCSICLEDYVNGEELGKLNCRHKFHVSCIKDWLVLNNTCPICKRTALAVEDDQTAEGTV